MALIRATYFLLTARGVFEAAPEGGLERGVLFNACSGSESSSTRARGKRIVLSFIFCLNRGWMDSCEESAEKVECFV